MDRQTVLTLPALDGPHVPLEVRRDLFPRVEAFGQIALGHRGPTMEGVAHRRGVASILAPSERVV